MDYSSDFSDRTIDYNDRTVGEIKFDPSQRAMLASDKPIKSRAAKVQATLQAPLNYTRLVTGHRRHSGVLERVFAVLYAVLLDAMNTPYRLVVGVCRIQARQESEVFGSTYSASVAPVFFRKVFAVAVISGSTTRGGRTPSDLPQLSDGPARGSCNG
jgi:hypothetical protein